MLMGFFLKDFFRPILEIIISMIEGKKSGPKKAKSKLYIVCPTFSQRNFFGLDLETYIEEEEKLIKKQDTKEKKVTRIYFLFSSGYFYRVFVLLLFNC